MLPNFLIIGAPRSGTDLLLHTLADHPQICMAREREVHFFDHKYNKGIAWYEEFFSHCSSGTSIGEKTANYLVAPECPQRIYDSLGEINLIISLRNPIDRAYSHYKNHIGWGAVDHELSFRDYLDVHPEALAMGNYFDHLSRYLQVFPRERIHIVLFEDLCNDFQNAYDSIISFLSLPQHALQEVKRYNASRKAYRLGKMALSESKVTKIAKWLPGVLSTAFSSFLEVKCIPLSLKDREYLREYYYEQNKKLKSLLNLPDLKW